MQPLADPFDAVPAVVAIPVRDEVERIGDCLLALSAQHGPPPGVVLLVNNTSDATMQAVAELAPSLRCPVVAIEHVFPPDRANAGQARRLALQHADVLAPATVPLLTTDADGRAAPDWLAVNLAALRSVDAVFGRAEIDPVEAARIPPGLHKADAEECAYADVLDEIASLVDPDPDDPWPRHTEHSGASIAVRRAMYRHVGGIPGIPVGEDRAFHQALREADARIRHSCAARVVVSGRILGRAKGGMADTIRRRLVAPDTMVDSALEPAADRLRRVQARRDVRAAMAGGAIGEVERLAAGLGIALDRLAFASFGAAWAVIEDGLPSVRVPVAELPAQMAIAVAIRDRLLQGARVTA